jgi:hypothetical protein
MQVTYAPEDQAEPTAAHERNSIGAPSIGGSEFVGFAGLALPIRVSDLCANRRSHRHRSFAVTDEETWSSETCGHGRGNCVWCYAPSGTSAQCLGNRLRYFGRHVDMPYRAGTRRRQSFRLHMRDRYDCPRNASVVLRVPSLYRDRPWDRRGLANQLRSQTDSVRRSRLRQPPNRQIGSSKRKSDPDKPRIGGRSENVGNSMNDFSATS